MAIISAEKRKRDEKTARLRAARETAEDLKVADGTPKSADQEIAEGDQGIAEGPDDGA